MKLELTQIRAERILDDATLTDYIKYQGKSVAQINREIYLGSNGFQEMHLDGHYYAYHCFHENGKNFATLTPYRLDVSNCSKRTYKFGCIKSKSNSIFWFFRGKNLGKSREQAIQVYNELKMYCDAQGEGLIPFAMKA